MPFTLIPDGFELKKVTALQKEAVDEYFGRERRGTNVSSFLGNENTPLLIGGAALVALTPLLLDFIRELLAEAGTLIPDVDWEKVKKGVLDSALLGGGGQLLVDFFRKNGNSVYSETKEKFGI
jgi:hypothetical protein